MNDLRKTTVKVGKKNDLFPCLTAFEEGHVPFNKRRWDIEQSTATLEIVHCPENRDGGWLEINLSETTQAKRGGPFQTRTIAFYLHGDDRLALIKMLGSE